MRRLRRLGAREIREAGRLKARRAARALGFCLLAGLLFSCATAKGSAAKTGETSRRAAYPRARFVVLCDPHVYDPADYSPTPAQAAAIKNGFLYGRSAALFREALSEAMELRPDFVLIPGDLTKDGELESHERVIRELSRLSEAGIRAYVVPGNHDVENPRAQTYVGGKARALPSPTREDFARLYSDFGYGGALSRDRYSLSYVAQLLPGLRLLALDPFRRPSVPNFENPEPASAIGRGTMAWIRKELERARLDGEEVIVMSHLSLVEHFEGQAKFFPSSLPPEREELGSLLSSRGVSLAFTGHFHILDVVRGDFPGGRALYDVATGSLVFYPMPYRVVELGEGGEGGGTRASIRSVRLAETKAELAGASEDALRGELEAWMASILEQKLRRVFVPRAEAASIASSFARAYLALVSGDESPAPGDDAFPEGVKSLTGRLAEKRLAPLLKSLWRDLPPEDNDLAIDLERR